MKKLLCLFLILFLIPSVSFADFHSIEELQQYLLFTSPVLVAINDPVFLNGTIIDIRFLEENEYQMTVEVDDDAYGVPVGYNLPIFCGRFEVRDVPFTLGVGDHVDIQGTIDAVYSSPIIPMVLIKTINGTDDFCCWRFLSSI